MSSLLTAQRVLLRLAMAIAIVTSASAVDAATASWDRNSEPDVVGYKLSYGTEPGVHTTSIDVGNVTTYQFFPTPGQRYYVVVQAYNAAGELSDKSAEVSIDLPLSNNPPALTQPGNQSSALNADASLTLSASDPDGTPLTFSAVGLPPGLSINTTSGSISGTPSVAGNFQVIAIVSDGALSATRVFTWTIVEPLSSKPIAAPKMDMAFDFGVYGVWLNYETGWESVNTGNPSVMASGDVDGNGQSDLILDFPGQGVWIWLNNSRWFQLDARNSGQIVTADLDGNGRSAVVLDFPGNGTWVWRYEGTRNQLHDLSPLVMTVGDLDGNGRDEVVIDFAGAGVWTWTNNQSWSQITSADVTSMVVGNFDGNEDEDVLLNFRGGGIWVWRNNASWSQLHTLGAALMSTADLDGNGIDESIIDFPGLGLWVSPDGASWYQLDAREAQSLTAADFDGNGQSELVVDFGDAGLWAWWNNSSWVQLNSASPEGSVQGRFKQRN